MSLDPSLKGAASLIRHRNVLTRAERISRLSGEGKWASTSNSALGLVKVGNRKLALAAKTAKKEDAAVAGVVAPAGKAAPAGKGAPAGKAAPGAKGAPAGKAAPAGKGAAAGKAAPAAKGAAKK